MTRGRCSMDEENGSGRWHSEGFEKARELCAASQECVLYFVDSQIGERLESCRPQPKICQ